MDTTNRNSNQVNAYDAAGDVLNDGLNQYLYDAEGRLCAVKGTASATEYVYDAEGRRVAKGTLLSWPTACVAPTSSNGFTLTASYVLGLGGEQVSEVNGSGAWQHTNVFANGKLLATYRGSDTYFSFTDWLGTKRAEYTPDALLSTFSSLPYGDGLTTSGNAADATEQHYTGKERDAESGNDYFGARYYASTMGRFMSPDPLPWIHWQNGSRDDEQRFETYIANPQNLNMYAYVLNNPLSKTDPTGMNACGTNNDSTCHVTITFNARTKDANGKYNDQFKGLKGQAGYNATATVTVTGTGADGKAFTATATFLAKTTPDSPATGAPLANGTYMAVAGTHKGQYPDIHINDGRAVPTTGPNPNQGGTWFTTGDEIHRSGMNGAATASDPTHPVSQGCQTIYRDQYSDFLTVTGRVPVAGTAQRQYTVNEEANGSPQ